jgi:hypothetical protein
MGPNSQAPMCSLSVSYYSVLHQVTSCMHTIIHQLPIVSHSNHALISVSFDLLATSGLVAIASEYQQGCPTCDPFYIS